MNPLLTDIPEGAGIDEATSTWIDLSVCNSVLAGFLLLVGAVWGMVLIARLWQHHLRRAAGPALGRCEALGLRVAPGGLRGRVVARGAWAGKDLRVDWRGGVWGERCVIYWGDRVRRMPLIVDGPGLDAALAAVSGSP
jgi:hypothetical protein